MAKFVVELNKMDDYNMGDPCSKCQCNQTIAFNEEGLPEAIACSITGEIIWHDSYTKDFSELKGVGSMCPLVKKL